MPRQVTPERLAEYLRVLELHDQGNSFRDIANIMGFSDPRTSRFMWIGGLRHSGRTSEIPVSTPRRVRVQHNGRTTTLVVDEQTAWTTNSTLTFGIEIECVGLSTRMAEHALRNAGITCENNGYNHTTRPVWKVVTDASLHSRNGSCEVVSPVLSGSDGLTEVRTVMKVLRDAGARINESCGMHIHIGVDQLTQGHQARIIKAYGAWQWAMTAWILERRVNGNWSQLRSTNATTALASDWAASNDRRYLAGRHDRYYALNVASFQRHGTFEFRSHHGSLNGQNATAWIAMHLAFIDACKHTVTTDALCAALPFGASYDREVMSDGTQGTMPTRAHAVNAGRHLLQRLTGLQTGTALNADVCAYLTQRAGNIPTRNSNNNQ